MYHRYNALCTLEIPGSVKWDAWVDMAAVGHGVAAGASRSIKGWEKWPIPPPTLKRPQSFQPQNNIPGYQSLRDYEVMKQRSWTTGNCEWGCQNYGRGGTWPAPLLRRLQSFQLWVRLVNFSSLVCISVDSKMNLRAQAIEQCRGLLNMKHSHHQSQSSHNSLPLSPTSPLLWYFFQCTFASTIWSLVLNSKAKCVSLGRTVYALVHLWYAIDEWYQCLSSFWFNLFYMITPNAIHITAWFHF